MFYTLQSDSRLEIKADDDNLKAMFTIEFFIQHIDTKNSDSKNIVPFPGCHCYFRVLQVQITWYLEWGVGVLPTGLLGT